MNTSHFHAFLVIFGFIWILHIYHFECAIFLFKFSVNVNAVCHLASSYRNAFGHKNDTPNREFSKFFRSFFLLYKFYFRFLMYFTPQMHKPNSSKSRDIRFYKLIQSCTQNFALSWTCKLEWKKKYSGT